MNLQRCRLCFLLCCLCWLSAPNLHAQLPFEEEIKAFEAANAAAPPSKGAIVLYGSSTMRLWTTYENDLKGYQVYNRGFGGSQMSDAIAYFDRVIVPLAPSLILLYEGDNDLSSGESVEQIFGEYKTFLTMVHQRFPKTKVAIYTIRPSLAREQNMSKQQELNALFRKHCKKHKKKAFLIEGYAALLTPEGRPNGDLLVEDKLHLNARGYAVWTRLTLDFLKAHPPR